MHNGFFRVAAAAPAVTIANTQSNASEIISLMNRAYEQDADMVVFPELCVTAYTCGDLFHNSVLLNGAEVALGEIIGATAKMPGMLVVVGAPLCYNGAIYNCAIAAADGKGLLATPKTYIPNYNEFYERRWFAPAPESLPADAAVASGIPFSTEAIVRYKGVGVAMEICEDLWTPVPPSCRRAMGGAEIVANLSASDDLIGKYAYLRTLISQQSARCICAYAYASCGFGESSTDLVFDAKLFIAENGRILSHNERWHCGNQLIVSDVDLEALRRDRLHNTSFSACARRNGATALHAIEAGHADDRNDISDLLRYVDPHPFVPSDKDNMQQRCEEILNIQVAALAQRLAATHTKTLVVGISGGLDSTLALLVAVRTFDRLGLDRKGIVGVTMPGFGTTDRTYDNAMTLMRTLGISIREIKIAPAVMQHFADIGHDASVHDVTYENCQARERTQILMDVANQAGGMVLGTGDLSELALGWATYNGDHMSMYGVNAGVPKTLIAHLVRYCALQTTDDAEKAALLDIVDTPISPELIPAEPDGTIKQKTEDLVGPYELHDFFIYYMLRYGFSPKRVFFLARHAFGGVYDDDTIKKWLRVFYRRFFAQQFKRSCLPDGPKVGSVSLSPRGDWRMPSDASSAMWLKEVDSL